MASVSGVDYDGSQRAFPMIINGGSLTLRNVSVANNAGDVEMISNRGSLEISHSSFVSNISTQRGLLSSDVGATIRRQQPVRERRQCGLRCRDGNPHKARCFHWAAMSQRKTAAISARLATASSPMPPSARLATTADW